MRLKQWLTSHFCFCHITETQSLSLGPNSVSPVKIVQSATVKCSVSLMGDADLKEVETDSYMCIQTHLVK